MYIDGTLKTLHKLINNCPSSFSSINSIHSVHNDAVFYLRKSFEMNLRGLYWWSWLYVYSISSVAAGVDLFFHSNKYILKFGQIHFKLWTNTFWNLDKYILPFGQIQMIVCLLNFVGGRQLWLIDGPNVSTFLLKIFQRHFNHIFSVKNYSTSGVSFSLSQSVSNDCWLYWCKWQVMIFNDPTDSPD